MDFHSGTRGTCRAVALALALAAQAQAAAVESVPAQFRGCESAGWCGIAEMRGNDAVSIAVRDRLNAMMSSFVHQHKRIVLYNLRDRHDGTYEAVITVNESPLEEDPVLQDLAKERSTSGC
jgi:hypothetical protein